MNEWNNAILPPFHADLYVSSWFSSFLVGQDGAIYEGVGWNVQGSHTPGYNDIALGIAFMGTFSGKWRLWAAVVIVSCLKDIMDNNGLRLRCHFSGWICWIFPASDLTFY